MQDCKDRTNKFEIGDTVKTSLGREIKILSVHRKGLGHYYMMSHCQTLWWEFELSLVKKFPSP